MSDSSNESANVNQTPDLGPLTLAQQGDRWRFTFTSPSEMTLELPPDYERYLTEKLAPLLGSSGKPAVELDLQGLPGISSRHLGLMLALQKTLADRYERLPLTGISDGVRRLLNLTRTAQFFDIS
ncbi:MAG: STAS domain-containing protein [Phycisphaerae bacterium]